MTAVDQRARTEVVRGLRPLAVLPDWVAAAADADRVRNALTRVIAASTTHSDLTITSVKPRLRLERDAWYATYRLAVARRDGEHSEVGVAGEYRPSRAARAGRAVVTGTFGQPDWVARLPELGLTLRTQVPDDALPAMRRLTDALAARVLLEEGLRGRYPGIRVAACVPAVMRYKPGRRCTVRYRVSYSPSGPEGPDTVVAKSYRGDEGESAYAGMTALEAADIPTRTVSLAAPLAYLREPRVLLQTALDEDHTLKDLVRRAYISEANRELAALGATVAKVADGLAVFHGCGVEHGERVTWEHRLGEVGDDISCLAKRVPELASAAAAYLRTLEALADECPPDPPGPTQGSFRPAQVLLCGQRVGFIDFDGLCVAEPAMDVARFRAALRDAGVLAASVTGSDDPVLSEFDELCHHFLDRYRAVRPVSPERVWLWESLDLLVFVLHCWSKIQPARLEPRISMLEHHLRGRGMIDTGQLRGDGA